jgi:hypothetical protein
MAAISGDQQVVRFGGFALDLQSGELTKKGNRVLLPDQPISDPRAPGSFPWRTDHARRLAS